MRSNPHDAAGRHYIYIESNQERSEFVRACFSVRSLLYFFYKSVVLFFTMSAGQLFFFLLSILLGGYYGKKGRDGWMCDVSRAWW